MAHSCGRKFDLIGQWQLAKSQKKIKLFFKSLYSLNLFSLWRRRLLKINLQCNCYQLYIFLSRKKQKQECLCIVLRQLWLQFAPFFSFSEISSIFWECGTASKVGFRKTGNHVNKFCRVDCKFVLQRMHEASFRKKILRQSGARLKKTSKTCAP